MLLYARIMAWGKPSIIGKISTNHYNFMKNDHTDFRFSPSYNPFFCLVGKPKFIFVA